MAFKRTCECGENTEAMYYYKAIKEGKFDIWVKSKYIQTQMDIRMTQSCGINCKTEAVVVKEEGIPYD